MNNIGVAPLLLFITITVSDVANVTSERKANTGVNYYWRDFNGTIPSDALPTGHDDIYIVEMIVRNCGNIPGSWYCKSQIAITAVCGMKVTATSNIKILCTPEPHRFKWELINVGSLKDEALWSCLQAGYEFEPVYIGKTFHENEWKIGKVFPVTSSWKGLNVWRDSGYEYVIPDFEILMYD